MRTITEIIDDLKAGKIKKVTAGKVEFVAENGTIQISSLDMGDIIPILDDSAWIALVALRECGIAIDCAN